MSSDREKRFNEIAAVSAAERVVTNTRLTELTEQQLTARRRLSAAKGLLTKAQRDGAADKIAAARERLRRTEQEFQAISHEVITEAKAIFDENAVHTQDLLDLMKKGPGSPW